MKGQLVAMSGIFWVNWLSIDFGTTILVTVKNPQSQREKDTACFTRNSVVFMHYFTLANFKLMQVYLVRRVLPVFFPFCLLFQSTSNRKKQVSWSKKGLNDFQEWSWTFQSPVGINTTKPVCKSLKKTNVHKGIFYIDYILGRLCQLFSCCLLIPLQQWWNCRRTRTWLSWLSWFFFFFLFRAKRQLSKYLLSSRSSETYLQFFKGS